MIRVTHRICISLIIAFLGITSLELLTDARTGFSRAVGILLLLVVVLAVAIAVSNRRRGNDRTGDESKTHPVLRLFTVVLILGAIGLIWAGVSYFYELARALGGA